MHEAKGLYFPVDAGKAIAYYNKAINQDNAVALRNKLRLCLTTEGEQYKEELLAEVNKKSKNKVVHDFLEDMLSSSQSELSVLDFLSLETSDQMRQFGGDNSDASIEVKWSCQVYEYDYLRANVTNDTFTRTYIGKESRYGENGLTTFYKYDECSLIRDTTTKEDTSPTTYEWAVQDFIDINLSKELDNPNKID